MTTQILQTSSHFPSSPISSPSPNSQNTPFEKSPISIDSQEEQGNQLSLLEILVAVFRKSLTSCTEGNLGIYSRMEIGSPSDVRHVAHVTFDRFDGFLGLPDEFESDVPRKPPSASASVFGVSTESMQLSFDSRGNSVPTILLMMQRRLYAQGGLQAEGIFRINADNSQDEYVRDQLNKGVVPDGVDVHSLAGLIKAWFRELPKGVLDPLSPEQVMQSQSEDEYAELVKLLPSTEASLLDWAINLMADIAQLENLNKMNAHNVAMVFAPNMTQMSDPLTALMYAVQVMNFLKILIIKKLREREDSIVEHIHSSDIDPSDENGHDSSSLPCINEEEEEEHDSTIESRAPNFLSSIENIIRDENGFSVDNFNGPNEPDGKKNYCDIIPAQNNCSKKGSKKVNSDKFAQKNKGTSIVNPINSRSERLEAWR